MAKKENVLNVERQVDSTFYQPVALYGSFGPKKVEFMRFCVDYFQFKNVTMKDSYLLPRVDYTLDTLARSKLLSTLDSKSGYWQIAVGPVDKRKQPPNPNFLNLFIV